MNGEFSTIMAGFAVAGVAFAAAHQIFKYLFELIPRPSRRNGDGVSNGRWNTTDRKILHDANNNIGKLMGAAGEFKQSHVAIKEMHHSLRDEIREMRKEHHQDTRELLQAMTQASKEFAEFWVTFKQHVQHIQCLRDMTGPT